MFMHTVSRTRLIVLEASPLQPIEPSILAELRNGAELADGLYQLVAGGAPPPVQPALKRHQPHFGPTSAPCVLI